MEECCLKNLRNHFKKVESEGRRKKEVFVGAPEQCSRKIFVVLYGGGEVYSVVLKM